MRPNHALIVLLLSSCAAKKATIRSTPVLLERAACAGDFCAPELDDLRYGEVLFEQVGRDAAAIRVHLSDVSNRSELFGPDIERLQRMFEGLERVRQEGLELLERRERASAWARLNALVLALPVLTIQLEYLAVASRAEDAGVVSTHWLGMLGRMRERTEPLLQSMVGFDVRRMEAAALAYRKNLEDLQGDLPAIHVSMLKGARWTQTALFLANGIMVAASAYEMAVAFRGMGGGPGAAIRLRFPALAGAGAGTSGGVVVLSAEVLESLQELRRLGALSDVVVATVAAMMGKPDPPSGQPVIPPHPGRTYPSRPPDPNAQPRGKPEPLRPRDSAGNNLAIQRQNEAAVRLARAGYDVEQLPTTNKQRSPDFKIEGRVFDNYAPTTDKPSNIWSAINGRKVNPPDGKTRQSSRIVLNLADSMVDIAELKAHFASKPMLSLEEVIAITREGSVVHIWP